MRARSVRQGCVAELPGGQRRRRGPGNQFIAGLSVEAVSPKMPFLLDIDQPHDHAHTTGDICHAARQAVARLGPPHCRSGGGGQPDGQDAPTRKFRCEQLCQSVGQTVAFPIAGRPEWRDDQHRHGRRGYGARGDGGIADPIERHPPAAGCRRQLTKAAPVVGRETSEMRKAKPSRDLGDTARQTVQAAHPSPRQAAIAAGSQAEASPRNSEKCLCKVRSGVRVTTRRSAMRSDGRHCSASIRSRSSHPAAMPAHPGASWTNRVGSHAWGSSPADECRPCDPGRSYSGAGRSHAACSANRAVAGQAGPNSDIPLARCIGTLRRFLVFGCWSTQCGGVSS